MQRIVSKNATLRVISIVSAILLWLLVLDNTNPVGSIDLTVPLELSNKDSINNKGIVAKNKNVPKTVKVSIKGRKEKLSTFNANDVEAKIDFSKIQDNDSSILNVEVKIIKEGVFLEGVNPRAVNLELENIGENNFKVEIVPVGMVKQNYKILKMSSIPDLISIQGSDSLLKLVDKAKVFVDISKIDRDVVIKKECKLYNRKGEEITELGKISSVNVKFSVAKEVPIIPFIQGNLATNYIQSVGDVIPCKAFIAGDSNVISEIQDIKTKPINIENENANIEKMSKIDLPAGVRLIDTPDDVLVNIVIEPKGSKDITITKNKIDSYDSYH